MLTPHPFYQDRGTPIDVLLLLRVLTERPDYKIDLLTYGEGSDVDLPNLRIHRIAPLRFTRNIRPGLSWKKLICDWQMTWKALSLVRSNRYDLIHAGEEAVFLARVFKMIYGIPYVYDLDSSLPQQIADDFPLLRIFSPLFRWMEKHVIRDALANLPVCKALEELCDRNGSAKSFTIYDISQIEKREISRTGELRQEAGIPDDKLLLLYSGNLAPYQGVDLLLNSFQIAARPNREIELAIIGGGDGDLTHYKTMAKDLEIDNRTHFLGPKPFDRLGSYMADADILVSPRIHGMNTPLKVFPYLHSGKPLLATDLRTHNQIISKNEAYLAQPDPLHFAEAILELSGDSELRDRLGRNGRAFIEQNHTFEKYRDRLDDAYDWIEAHVFS